MQNLRFSSSKIRVIMWNSLTFKTTLSLRTNTVTENWKADVIYTQEYWRQNRGFKYILTVIDILSKYLWAVPLKSKSANDIVFAFKLIFKDRKPLKLHIDQGLEFDNIQFKKLCKDRNIIIFISKDKKIKYSTIERVNRTLKEKMFRCFTANGTRKYIDVLEKWVYSYNKRYHRSIKMKPIEVNESNERIAYGNLYGTNKLNSRVYIAVLGLGSPLLILLKNWNIKASLKWQ